MAAQIVQLKEKRQQTFNERAKKEAPKHKDLIALSEVDFTGKDSSKEKLIETQKMIERLILIVEGLCVSRPSQSSYYAMTNLLAQYSEVTSQIEGVIDYEALASSIYRDFYVKSLEDLIKALATNIKNTKDKLCLKKSAKIQKKYDILFTELFRKFGAEAEQIIKAVEEDLTEFILDKV